MLNIWIRKTQSRSQRLRSFWPAQRKKIYNILLFITPPLSRTHAGSGTRLPKDFVHELPKMVAQGQFYQMGGPRADFANRSETSTRFVPGWGGGGGGGGT